MHNCKSERQSRRGEDKNVERRTAKEREEKDTYTIRNRRDKIRDGVTKRVEKRTETDKREKEDRHTIRKGRHKLGDGKTQSIERKTEREQTETIREVRDELIKR